MLFICQGNSEPLYIFSMLLCWDRSNKWHAKDHNSTPMSQLKAHARAHTITSTFQCSSWKLSQWVTQLLSNLIRTEANEIKIKSHTLYADWALISICNAWSPNTGLTTRAYFLFHYQWRENWTWLQVLGSLCPFYFLAFLTIEGSCFPSCIYVLNKPLVLPIASENSRRPPSIP